MQGHHLREIAGKRVVVVGPNSRDDFAWEITKALQQLGASSHGIGSTVSLRPGGHDRLSATTRSFLSLAYRTRQFGDWVDKRLLERILRQGPDLVITVESLRPLVVERIRAAGIPVVLWFPDHVANIAASWMFSAPYTAVFFKEPWLVRRCRELLDLPVYLLHEACLPSDHYPVDGPALSSVCVVGNLYPTRLRLLERLHADGVPLALYGPKIADERGQALLRACHTGRYLRGVDKSQIFRNSIAVLNNLHPAEIEGVNKRLFEATAAGGSVITEDRTSLASLYDKNSEVIAFSTYDELRDAIALVQDDKSAFRQMGLRASKRAMRDHSYARRLEELLSKIEEAW